MSLDHISLDLSSESASVHRMEEERGGNDTESNKTWRERKKGKRGEKEEKVLPGGGRKYIHN